MSVTHRFDDGFVAIAPPKLRINAPTTPVAASALGKLFERHRWLMISDDTQTGKRLRAWTTRAGLKVEAAMEADNFDLIVNLVSLGFGVSIVPHRVLALHPQSRPVRRIVTDPKFSRELIVVVRRQAKMPASLRHFVDDILF